MRSPTSVLLVRRKMDESKQVKLRTIGEQPSIPFRMPPEDNPLVKDAN